MQLFKMITKHVTKNVLIFFDQNHTSCILVILSYFNKDLMNLGSEKSQDFFLCILHLGVLVGLGSSLSWLSKSTYDVLASLATKLLTN